MLLLPLLAPPLLLVWLLLVPAVLVLWSCCTGCGPPLSCSVPEADRTWPGIPAGLTMLLLLPLAMLVPACAAAAGVPAGAHPAGSLLPVT
jgi:hypothetical protein